MVGDPAFTRSRLNICIHTTLAHLYFRTYALTHTCTYFTHIHNNMQVMARINSGAKLSDAAVVFMDDLLSHTSRRIYRVYRRLGTCGRRQILSAIELAIPGNLSKHAINECFEAKRCDEESRPDLCFSLEHGLAVHHREVGHGRDDAAIVSSRCTRLLHWTTCAPIRCSFFPMQVM